MTASTAFQRYAQDYGGRVLLLFLLFLLAIYEFVSAGFSAFAAICCIPIIILVVLAAFHYRLFCFWLLFFFNFIVQWHSIRLPQGVPISMYNEMFEIILLVLAILDVKESRFERCGNIMLFTIMVWCGYCTIEMLNDTCNLGINIGAWYQGTRLMAFQLLYAFLVYTLYISSPKILIQYLIVWGIFSLFSSFWVWKQQNIGLEPSESAWLYGPGRVTHIIQGGTLIRYFSTYSDAANFGIGIASTAVAFLIFALTSRIKKHRIFFLVTGLACTWAMFPSGTRTAIGCFMAGIATYVFLSKSFKVAIPVSIIFGLFVFFLAFTNIGNGNSQIRRMRSAFDKNDASTNVRKVNQEAMKKYMKEAPWGLGVGLYNVNVPANNKYMKVVNTPSDSEYVSIWVRTGVIGLTTFLICTAIMIIGACCIIFFKLKSPSLRGIGAGLSCAMVSQQIGGYGNMVLMQFPNCLIFYGGLSLVFVLPYIEKEWIEYENRQLAIQEEKKRLKLKKRRESRV